MGQEVICRGQLPRALASGRARILSRLQPDAWHGHFLCLPQSLACSLLDAGQIETLPQAGLPGPVNSSLLEKRLRVVETELPQPCRVEEGLTERAGFWHLASRSWEAGGYITLDRVNSLCCYNRDSPPALRSALPRCALGFSADPSFKASVCSPVSDSNGSSKSSCEDLSDSLHLKSFINCKALSRCF